MSVKIAKLQEQLKEQTDLAIGYAHQISSLNVAIQRRDKQIEKLTMRPLFTIRGREYGWRKANAN